MKPVQRHVRMKSGEVVWCSRCGVYADKTPKGLSNICEGTPPRQRHRGGMEGQLRKLRNNQHPKTLQWFPLAVAIDVDPNMVKDDASKVLPEEELMAQVQALQETTVAVVQGVSMMGRKLINGIHAMVMKGELSWATWGSSTSREGG